MTIGVSANDSATADKSDDGSALGRATEVPVIGPAIRWCAGHDAIASLVVYLLMACYLLHSLVLHPTTTLFQENGQDQIIFTWMLGAVATSLRHLHNPLYTHLINAPIGANVIANPSIFLYSLVFTPLTLTAGPAVSHTIILVSDLVAAGVAWRWFLLRNTDVGRVGAFVGGLLCAFGPAMVAQSIGHTNLAAQWAVPLIIDQILRLVRLPKDAGWRRAAKHGVLLGLLVVVQVLIGEEVLLIAAMGFGVFVLWYALQAVVTKPRDTLDAVRAYRPGMPELGLGVGVGLAGAVLAYPLYYQFRGPESFAAIPYWPFAPWASDLRSFFLFPDASIAGSPKLNSTLVVSQSEQSSLYGWPLLLVVLAILVWRWRDPVVRAVFLSILTLIALAAGTQPQWNNTVLAHHGLWSVVDGLPFMKNALPIRVPMALAPLFAYLLATSGRKALRLPSRPLRYGAVGVLAAALVPLFPTPPQTYTTSALPPFITRNEWRQCATPGTNLMAVPYPTDGRMNAMRWQYNTVHGGSGMGFPIVGGRSFGPGYGPHTVAISGPLPRFTSIMLQTVDSTGTVPHLTAADRAKIADDMAFWNTNCVIVLDAAHPAADARVLTTLFGPSQEIGGVRVWRPRDGATAAHR
jgi:hypothetical protein